MSPKLTNEHPISSSKCHTLEYPVLDNGRVVSAEKLSITVTEQDFITYSHFYNWEQFAITNFCWYDKQYLPKPFVLAILDLFHKKTTLKGIPEKEIEYMISKNMLNAAYGMSVTNPIRDILEYRDDEFFKSPPDVESAIETYNKSIRRFLFFPWGVWVTAYARRNLFKAIEAMGDDFVYSDTDSVKILNPESHAQFFEHQNDEILAKIAVASQFHGISAPMFSPKTAKGLVKTIGFWENEGTYELFKTLGAKRYLVSVDGDIHITLAGANKRKTADYLRLTGDPFGNFDDTLRIPADFSGRLTLTYLDDEIEGNLVDYTGVPYHYHEKSAIHMEKSQYELTMSDDFINYLKGVQDLE